YVVTARQSYNKTVVQLNSFGISSYIKELLVTQQRKTKEVLIRENNRITVTESDWFIGDTGNDIKVGKNLGIRTAAVLSGFMSQEKLLSYQPDIILNSITDFKI